MKATRYFANKSSRPSPLEVNTLVLHRFEQSAFLVLSITILCIAGLDQHLNGVLSFSFRDVSDRGSLLALPYSVHRGLFFSLEAGCTRYQLADV